jgi:peptide deformylase
MSMVETKRVEAAGWYARILQHEIDHLAGLLYVDRMRSCTLTTLENLDRFWKDLPTSVVLAKLKSGLGNRTSPSCNS